MSSSSPDIATKVNNIDRQLSVKDKERLVYLAEVLVNEANKDKSLIVLLADLRHKYCCEKEDSYDILRILLELAGLKKYADILRPQNQFMPPRLENYQYIPDEKCKIVSMRSCLIKLVSSLTTDSLRILLETLCHNIDSNPENYTSIYVLLRELEQRAIISPGRLEFIYEVLEKDDQFANVRKILVDYKEQFCNEERQDSSSPGNDPVHVDMSCPPRHQVPRQPLPPAGLHSLRAPHNPPPPINPHPPINPPPAQQPPCGVPPHHQMRGDLIQRQFSAPTHDHQNSPRSQSNRAYQSDSFQRPVPMNWSPDLQRNQSVQSSHQNQHHHFDPQTNQYHQPPDQYSNPPALHETNQYYRQQSGQHYRPQSGQYYRQLAQQCDQNYHPPAPHDQNYHPPAPPRDQNHFSSYPSSSLPSQAGPYGQYYHRPVLPQDQRFPPPLPPQQVGESLPTIWLQQQGTVVDISSQQQQFIDQSMNVPPPLPPPVFSGQRSQIDSGAVSQYSTNSWPNQPAGPTVQFYNSSSSVVGTNSKPAIRSRQNSEPAGPSLKRNPPPKKSHTLPENFSVSSRITSNLQTASSSNHQVHVSQSNSYLPGSPPAPADSLVMPRPRNPSPNSPGHSINVSLCPISRHTPSPGAQAASFRSNVTAPYDVEPVQVQGMRMENEEDHM